MIRRGPALVLLVLAIVAAVVIDLAPPGDPVVADPRPVDVGPVLDRPGTPPSWFCPTLRVTETLDEEQLPTGVTAEGTLLLVNSGAETVDAVVTVHGVSAAPEAQVVQVGPRATVELPVGELSIDPVVAAVVESDSDRLVAARELVGPTGTDVAPCLDRMADRWFVGSGSTAGDADLLYVLFNPLSEDAVVDLRTVSDAEDGLVAGDVDGVVVPAGQVRALDVGRIVRRRDVLATELVVRSGRVAIDEVSTRDGSAGRRGLSLGPGAVDTADSWLMAGGRSGQGVSTELVLHNPADRTAEVDIEIQTGAGTPIEPQQRNVPARDVVTVPLDEATFGLAAGIEFSVLVRTLTDIEIVAELGVRTVAGATLEDESTLVGGEDTQLGATGVATEWVVPLARNTAEGATVLVLSNPTGEPVPATVLRLGAEPLVQVTAVTVPAVGDVRVVLDTVPVERLSLLVRAESGIIVGGGGPGPVPAAVGWSAAVPVGVP